MALATSTYQPSPWNPALTPPCGHTTPLQTPPPTRLSCLPTLTSLKMLVDSGGTTASTANACPQGCSWWALPLACVKRLPLMVSGHFRWDWMSSQSATIIMTTFSHPRDFTPCLRNFCNSGTCIRAARCVCRLAIVQKKDRHLRRKNKWKSCQGNSVYPHRNWMAILWLAWEYCGLWGDASPPKLDLSLVSICLNLNCYQHTPNLLLPRDCCKDLHVYPFSCMHSLEACCVCL